MDPIFFVLAWLVYVAVFWSTLLRLDLRQRASRDQEPNSAGKFLRSLYARGRNFAAPQ
jgi:hypothetical protein